MKENSFIKDKVMIDLDYYEVLKNIETFHKENGAYAYMEHTHCINGEEGFIRYPQRVKTEIVKDALVSEYISTIKNLRRDIVNLGKENDRLILELEKPIQGRLNGWFNKILYIFVSLFITVIEYPIILLIPVSIIVWLYWAELVLYFNK